MRQEEGSQGEELPREMRALEGRDRELWSIGLLLILVVTAGFLALLFPDAIWSLETLRVDSRHLPQLFWGFISLVLLFTIYLLRQRRALRNARKKLLRQLTQGEAAEKFMLPDLLTVTFDRCYLDQIIAREASRADRSGSGLTLLVVDIDGFKSVNTRFGRLVGDQVLKEVAQLLSRAFRASDILIRYGGDEFLVVLADSDEQQAKSAARRLREQVDKWNRANTIAGYRMGLSCGLAAYTKGASLRDVLETADQRMYQDKARRLDVG